MSLGNNLLYTQTLNNRQLPTAMSVKNPATGLVAVAQTSVYDVNKNVKSITDLVNPQFSKAMSYDGLNRLVTANGPWGSGSFTYDSLGNIRSKTLGTRVVNISYDNATNRVSANTDSASSSRAFSYDSKGNVTSILKNGEEQVFRNDNGNFLRKITHNDYEHGYVLDGNNKRTITRIRDHVNGTFKVNNTLYTKDGKLSHILKFGYGANSYVEETDYIHVNGKTIARITGDNVTYLHNDIIGSPIAGTSSTGNVLWGEDYTPFGEKRIDDAVNHDKDGYTGHVSDNLTGLTYMQARYYDPVIGRFYSNDPVGFTGDITTFNRYSYVGNNPYTYTDPNGKTRWKIDAGIKLVGTTGGALNLGFSFDDESFEISITAGGSGRLGAEAGTDLSFSTEPSSTKGNTADGKVTTDLSIGTGEESIKAEGEYSSATGLDGNITLPSAIKVDANGVNLSPNIGASIGLGVQGTVNISIPDTINNISNAVSSAMNSVSEAANQCAANPGTSC